MLNIYDKQFQSIPSAWNYDNIRGVETKKNFLLWNKILLQTPYGSQHIFLLITCNLLMLVYEKREKCESGKQQNNKRRENSLSDMLVGAHHKCAMMKVMNLLHIFTLPWLSSCLFVSFHSDVWKKSSQAYAKIYLLNSSAQRQK